MQRPEPDILDLAAALLADPVLTLIETPQRLLDRDELRLRGVVNDLQRHVVLQLDRPVRRIRDEGIIAMLQILLQPLMPLPERGSPGNEHGPDFAGVSYRGDGHDCVALALVDSRT